MENCTLLSTFFFTLADWLSNVAVYLREVELSIDA